MLLTFRNLQIVKLSQPTNSLAKLLLLCVAHKAIVATLLLYKCQSTQTPFNMHAIDPPCILIHQSINSLWQAAKDFFLASLPASVAIATQFTQTIFFVVQRLSISALTTLLILANFHASLSIPTMGASGGLL